MKLVDFSYFLQTVYKLHIINNLIFKCKLGLFGCLKLPNCLKILFHCDYTTVCALTGNVTGIMFN